MKRIFVLFLAAFGTSTLGLWVFPACAQEQKEDLPTFSAFIDTYYGHDFGYGKLRRPYVTQPYYNDELAVNLSFADVAFSGNAWRGRLAVQDGTSVDINYAAEPHEGWKYLQEAYAGMQLGDGLWLDGGIFLSHIGMESWISRDNPTYSRSLVAEYSPYYQTGLRLSYEAISEWSFQLLGLRGWQNISDDRDLAVGTQIQWKPSSNLTLLHNTFLGNEGGNRIFNDFIMKWVVSDELNFAGQFDVGYQRLPTQDKDAMWHGWALIAQYKFTQTSIAGRVERFLDSEGAVLASASENHFGAYGLSFNIDYEILPRLVWRNEWRGLRDTKKVFPDGKNGFDQSSTVVVTSLSYTLR